jgi:hypothetical protein
MRNDITLTLIVAADQLEEITRRPQDMKLDTFQRVVRLIAEMDSIRGAIDEDK